MIFLILYSQIVTTVCMTGLIWFVQIVHYPLFAQVGVDEFTHYEICHQRKTTCVVAPLMIVELITSTFLILFSPVGIDRSLIWLGLGLVVMNWATTAFISVPCHEKLRQGFDERVQRRLVGTNWIRTFGWSLRSCVVFIQLHQYYSAILTSPGI